VNPSSEIQEWNALLEGFLFGNVNTNFRVGGGGTGLMTVFSCTKVRVDLGEQ
jgi:hypothetical protein